eukprot:4391303-Amphidinium_carterae.1
MCELRSKVEAKQILPERRISSEALETDNARVTQLGCLHDEEVMPELMGNPCVTAQPGQETPDVMADPTLHL